MICLLLHKCADACAAVMKLNETKRNKFETNPKTDEIGSLYMQASLVGKENRLRKTCIVHGIHATDKPTVTCRYQLK